MLSKILGFGRSGFDAYMSSLVRNNARGAPTADEARRDYRAATAARAVWPRA